MPAVVSVCRRETDECPTRGDLFLEMERSPGVDRVRGGVGGGGRALVGEGEEVGRGEGFVGSSWVLNHHLHHPHHRGPSSSSLLWPETNPHLLKRWKQQQPSDQSELGFNR